ncbi:MAG TPA: hypothetical protein VMR18_00105 [Candidatus Saccharimonadales bacterium]|nr:hypothetical protein [Candidatus Saccharimonadales bacterium]
MSHSIRAIKNKQQKHPKVDFHQYLYNSGEPSDDNTYAVPAELEAEMLESSFSMKRQLRYVARIMRSRPS